MLNHADAGQFAEFTGHLAVVDGFDPAALAQSGRNDARAGPLGLQGTEGDARGIHAVLP